MTNVFSDTQLFDGEGMAQENARMVFRVLKAGALKNQPRDHETNWGDYMELWGAELADFDYDILERAARTWLTTSGSESWPTLSAFRTWCGVVKREVTEDAKPAGTAVCETCEGKRYVAVRAGNQYFDPISQADQVATSNFAIPCWTCPDMENRYRLFQTGHFDLDHEPCGRCREYRIPGTRTKVNR